MEIENEKHCLIRCYRYADIRHSLFAAAIDVENVFVLRKQMGKNFLLFDPV